MTRAMLVLLAATAAGLVPVATRAEHPVPRTAVSETRVTGVRFWSLGDTTRVVIEVSDDFTYRSDHLPNPDRLFFDIVGAKPTTGRKISTTPVGDSIVRQIRVAETQPGTTRVVLDLEGDSAFTVTHRIRSTLHR